MRKFRKYISLFLSFFLCTIILLSFTLSVSQAMQVPKVEENKYVYDSEEILTTEEADKLNTMLRYLEERTSIEFAVITSSSFFGMTMDDYAHDLFNTLGLGKANKDNGILFLLSVGEGHARLEIGYGLESLLTDGLCGQILDKYYVPNRDSGKNKEAILETADGILAVLGQEYGIEFFENQSEIVKSINSKNSISITTIIIILVIVIILSVFLAEETGSGSSSGGFFSSGGFSSGGGGSFGGGHSGGGGAGR